MDAAHESHLELDSDFDLVPPPFMPPLHPGKPEATYDERHNINKYDVITLWTMSQQTGSVSYLVFGTGFSLLVLALCMILFGQTRSVPLFRTLGSNALVAYIIHGMAIDSRDEDHAQRRPPLVHPARIGRRRRHHLAHLRLAGPARLVCTGVNWANRNVS